MLNLIFHEEADTLPCDCRNPAWCVHSGSVAAARQGDRCALTAAQRRAPAASGRTPDATVGWGMRRRLGRAGQGQQADIHLAEREHAAQAPRGTIVTSGARGNAGGTLPPATGERRGSNVCYGVRSGHSGPSGRLSAVGREADINLVDADVASGPKAEAGLPPAVRLLWGGKRMSEERAADGVR